jgi:hypothetical protein
MGELSLSGIMLSISKYSSFALSVISLLEVANAANVEPVKNIWSTNVIYYLKWMLYLMNYPLFLSVIFIITMCLFPRLCAWTIESTISLLSAVANRIYTRDGISESKAGSFISGQLQMIMRIKRIQIGRVHIFPVFKIEGFDVEVTSSRSIPHVILIWKSFECKVHLRLLFQSVFTIPRRQVSKSSPADEPGEKPKPCLAEPTTPRSVTVTPIEITFFDFHIECIGLRFKDFIGPSSSLRADDDVANIAPKMKLLHYIMRSFAYLMKIQFLSSFDFDFTMTTHKAKVVGSSSKITIYALPSSGMNGDESLVMAMDIKDGALEIYRNGVSAMEYFGQLAQLRVDQHLPSGMQAVKMNFFGKDEAAVSIPTFLEFYQEYQNAEDDAIESKLARHLNIVGKMYDISMHMTQMKISLSDPRSMNICVLELGDLTMQMQTFMLTISHHRYIRGLHRIISDPMKSSDISMRDSQHIGLYRKIAKHSNILPSFDGLSPNLEKVLHMSVSTMRWPAYDSPSNLIDPAVAIVEKASMSKSLRVSNEGDYIDDEEITMSVENAEFQRVCLGFLEWLVIMQETSAAVPTSRFAHPKTSIMHGSMKFLIFSTSPTDLIHSMDDNDHDDLVVISAKAAQVTRRVLPRQTTSLMEGKAEVLRVHSSLYLTDLSAKYNLKSTPSEELHSPSNVRTGMLWTMPGLTGSMTLAEKTQFHRIGISNGLTIQLTAQLMNQHVTKHVDKESVVSAAHPLLQNMKKLRHSFMFANEKSINPLKSCTILATVMQSSIFDAVWSNDDITAELGDVEMNLSMGAMLKTQLSFRMILDMNRRVLGHMARIKAVNKKAGVTFPSTSATASSLDPINVARMHRLRVALSLGDSSIPSFYPNAEVVPLSMNMVMDEVEVLQSVRKQSYRWTRGEFLCNHWEEQPAFIHKDFYYESVLSSDSIRRQTVKLKEFIIGLSTLNRFGETMEAMNLHYEAYKLATAKAPSATWIDLSHVHHASQLPTDILRSEQGRLRPDPYILDLQFDSWIIMMDGPYAGNYRRNFMEMRYNGMIMHLDCSQRELDLYSKIAQLDYGLDHESEAAYLLHSNASGGMMDLNVKSYTVRCAGLESYSFRMKNYRVSGPIFSASIDDPRVAVRIFYTMLADPKLQVAAEDEEFKTEVYVAMKKSSAPSKLYFDLEVLCEEAVLNIDPLTSSYLDAFNYAMKWYSLPNRDAALFQNPLLWWDSLRYWMHGSYSLRINAYRISYALPSSPANLVKSKMTLLINISKFQLIIEKSSIESSCLDVDIDLEIIDASRYLRRGNLTAASPLNKILRLPGLLFSLSHTRITSGNQASDNNHHDVYLHPYTRDHPDNDAFARFRSQARSIQWHVELACLDSMSNPISIHARLDILSLLVQAFQTPSSTSMEKDEEESLPTTPIGVANSPTSHQAEGQPSTQQSNHLSIAATIVQQHLEASLPAPTSSSNSNSITMQDILQTIDLQVHIRNVMFHSWISNTSFAGIVFSLQHLELSLFMRRGTSTPTAIDETASAKPLAIENMYLLLEFAELYVRDWCVKDKSLDVIPSPAEMRRYFDPVASPTSALTASAPSLEESTRPVSGRPFSLSRTAAAGLESLAAIIQEPMRIQEVQELMQPIYKLAHASKVEMSLTENGNISKEGCNSNGMVLLNQSSAVDSKKIGSFSLLTSTGEVNALLGSENRRLQQGIIREKGKHLYQRYRILMRYQSISSTASAQLRSNSHNSQAAMSAPNPLFKAKKAKKSPSRSKSSRHASIAIATGAFRPTLTNFLSNHAALMPPHYALPLSYQGNRPQVPSSPTSILLSSTTRSSRINRSPSISSPRNLTNKIWGLRIIDMRLLWTLEIRDVIFNYVSRSFDVYRTPSSTDSATAALLSPDAVDTKNPNPAPSSASSDPSSAAVSSTPANTKAILTDFRRITKIRHSSHANMSDLQAITANETELQRKSKSRPSTSRSRRFNDSKRLSKTDNAAVPIDPELSRFVSDNSSTRVVAFDRELSGNLSPEDSVASLHSMQAYTPPSSYPTPNPPPPPTGSFSPILSSNGSSKKSMSMTSPSAADPLREKKILRGRSVNAKRSNLLDRNLSHASEESLTRSPGSRSYSPLAKSSPATSIAGDPYQNPNSTVLHHRSFVVELIEPQINFLDVTSHSSMVILAGRSQFEGYRGDLAFQPRDRNAAESATATATATTPKRKSELKLSMDGVSAYTAPTLIGLGDHDHVHWKVMDNTVTERSISSFASPAYLTNKRRNSISPTAESSPLRVAIKDFQIRAQYAFWMDVLASEARSMTVILSPDELLCAFTLDLPEIIVDTDSNQFYITLNVIRNLLLVPPPALPNLATKVNPQIQSVIDRSRYEKIFERYGIKMTNPLPAIDLNSRAMRDVIKSLVEDDSSIDRSTDMISMARVVQVYIGKGVWLLRGSATASSSSATASSSSTAATAQMMVETGFTGVYATFTYHEDRSASILFETQRFWARNESSSSASSSATANSSVAVMSTPSRPLPSSWIMLPVLQESEPCVRCGAIFHMESNHSTSCAFHADQDGYPGQYLDTVVYDELTQQSIRTPMWSCCGRTQADAAGCNSRPHICKEIMISIRAETNPLIRIHNLDIQILHALDISFFPGALYDMHVELSRHVIDMLHSFFSIEVQSDATEPATGATAPPAVPVPPTPAAAAANSTASLLTTVHQEVLYVNYLRLGDINVDVSTSGFPLNIENYHAVVEPFICRGEVLNWHRLIASMERHAMISVTKNFASNIGNRIGNIFLGSKPTTRGSVHVPLPSSSTPSTATATASSTSAMVMSSGSSSSSARSARFLKIPRSIAETLLGSSNTTAAEVEDKEDSMRKRNLLLGNHRRPPVSKKT